jgi:hypothetical protein
MREIPALRSPVIQLPAAPEGCQTRWTGFPLCRLQNLTAAKLFAVHVPSVDKQGFVSFVAHVQSVDKQVFYKLTGGLTFVIEGPA